MIFCAGLSIVILFMGTAFSNSLLIFEFQFVVLLECSIGFLLLDGLTCDLLVLNLSFADI